MLTEAKRVHDFKAVCDGDMDEEAKVKELGKLMNES